MGKSSEFARQLIGVIEQFIQLPEAEQREITVSVIKEVAGKALEEKNDGDRRYGKIFKEIIGAPIQDFRSVEEVTKLVSAYYDK